MELLRLAKDIIDRKANPIDYPCHMLGGTVARNKEELNDLLSTILLLTYRCYFRALPRSNVTSDKGWGCLIRTSQMLLARALRLHGACELSWFMDVENSPLSIHHIVKIARDQRQNFEAGFWSPSQGCEAIRRVVQEMSRSTFPSLKVRRIEPLTAVSGCVNLKDVQDRMINCQGSLLLLVPIRAVAHRCITQSIFLAMAQLLQLKQCCGIVGGVPNRSYYIIGVEGERFIYLDPHTTQPAYTSDQTLGHYFERASTLPAVSWKRIDSSILLGFYIRDQDDWLDFVYGLEESRKMSSEQLISIQPSTRRLDPNDPGWDDAAAAKWAFARQEEFKASRVRKDRKKKRRVVGHDANAPTTTTTSSSPNSPPQATSSSVPTTSTNEVNVPTTTPTPPSSPPPNTKEPSRHPSADSLEIPAFTPPPQQNQKTQEEGGGSTEEQSPLAITTASPSASPPVSSSTHPTEQPLQEELALVASSKNETLIIDDDGDLESSVEDRTISDDDDDDEGSDTPTSPYNNTTTNGGGAQHKGLGDVLLLDNAIRTLLNSREMQVEGVGGGQGGGTSSSASCSTFVGVTLVSDAKKSKKRSLKRRTRALWQRLTTGGANVELVAAPSSTKRTHPPNINTNTAAATNNSIVLNSNDSGSGGNWSPSPGRRGGADDSRVSNGTRDSFASSWDEVTLDR